MKEEEEEEEVEKGDPRIVHSTLLASFDLCTLALLPDKKRV